MINKKMSTYKSLATPGSYSNIDETNPVLQPTRTSKRNTETTNKDPALIKTNIKEDVKISDNGTTITKTEIKQETFTTTDMGEVAKKYLTDGFFWLFFIIAAIVIVAFYFIAYAGLVWVSALDKLGWLQYQAVYYAFFVLTYLIVAIPAYIGFANSDAVKKGAIFSSFFITSVLWILWAIVFFLGHELTWSVVIGAFLLISSMMLLVTVWSADRNCGICAIIWFVFVVLTYSANIYIYAYNMPNNVNYTIGAPANPQA